MKVGNKINPVVQVKPTIIKGHENLSGGANIDANKMAQIESQKGREKEQSKRDKIESFMNSTRMNASKLYKEKVQQNAQKQQQKKVLLEKQRELKSKYTVIPAKKEPGEKIQTINQQPMQVNWKQAEDVMRKVQIPVERPNYNSSDEESGYDSEVDPEKTENPIQVMEAKKSIREHMLAKLKR